MSKVTQMSVFEFERRIKQFASKNVLIGNVATGESWTIDEVSRVMLRKLINADWTENEEFKSSIYDPANYDDKLSIQHDLRAQYYTDNNMDQYGKVINARELIDNDTIPALLQYQSH